MSKKTIKKMKERNKTWKRYRQFPSGRNFEAYKKIRNEVNALVREDEDTNTKRILQGFKSKPKRFYEYMRSVQRVKENVMALKMEDGELTKTD